MLKSKALESTTSGPTIAHFPANRVPSSAEDLSSTTLEGFKLLGAMLGAGEGERQSIVMWRKGPNCCTKSTLRGCSAVSGHLPSLSIHRKPGRGEQGRC